MPETGKIDREFFETEIRPRLGADREDVVLGPRAGVDFGVVDVGGQALVCATDPISIPPAIGFERAGRFAARIVLADAAVSGLAPSHLSISFALPPSMSDDAFARVWEAIDAECRDLGVAITTGHTARYEGCQFPWVGSATALAVGDHDDVVRPNGARPGDDIVVTKGPAVEAVGLLTTLFPDAIDLGPGQLDTCQALLDDTDAVRDAVAVAEAGGGGVSAMHDTTEGGLLGALHEMADSAGVRFSVDTGAVPVQPGVQEACDALGMDPWRATNAGALLITTAPGVTEDVVATLEARGTPTAVVGRVQAGGGVLLDGERTTPPTRDASWPVYERLADE
jgi:hydrogenase expression/formation protein HypE